MELDNNMSTIREKILKILVESRKPLTAAEIALKLGLDPHTHEKIIYEHILHIAKTVRRQSKGKKQVYMVPPRCKNCGYVFHDLNKPRKPSRCPRCKSYRVEPPRFYIA